MGAAFPGQQTGLYLSALTEALQVTLAAACPLGGSFVLELIPQPHAPLPCAAHRLAARPCPCASLAPALVPSPCPLLAVPACVLGSVACLLSLRLQQTSPVVTQTVLRSSGAGSALAGTLTLMAWKISVSGQRQLLGCTAWQPALGDRLRFCPASPRASLAGASVGRHPESLSVRWEQEQEQRKMEGTR